MMVLGSRTSSPDPMSKAFFTAETSRVLPMWIVRNDEIVDSSMPDILRRLISLLGVRTRAMQEKPDRRVRARAARVQPPVAPRKRIVGSEALAIEWCHVCKFQKRSLCVIEVFHGEEGRPWKAAILYITVSTKLLHEDFRRSVEKLCSLYTTERIR